MSGGKNNFEEIKNMITKDDLKKAFEQGERYSYRPTWASCFNKWYNQTFIDSKKCDSCCFGKLKNNKNCKDCVEFLNFKNVKSDTY